MHRPLRRGTEGKAAGKREAAGFVCMICKTRAELPPEYGCKKCGASKPIGEMVLVHRRRTHDFLLRPRCKKCHNTREKGHRREWKRKYLQRWRKNNAEVNESYWRLRQAELRPELNARSYRRFRKNHAAILIQGRMRRQARMRVSVAEAKELLRKYGRCYPTRWGLTAAGIAECERIRSRFRSARRSGKKVSQPRPVEIRMMVYADGTLCDPGDREASFVIKPRLQKQPYQLAAKRLKKFHIQRRILTPVINSVQPETRPAA
jgi:hypothetical protein